MNKIRENIKNVQMEPIIYRPPNIQCIAEHSVDLSLLTRESKVLDLGCRSFDWAKAILEYVDGIICVDADETIEDPEDDRINFIEGVVVPNGTPQTIMPFVVYGNGTGNYIDDGRLKPKGSKVTAVLSITLEEIEKGAGKADLIKFDIEGAEVPVLLSMTEAPAAQLSIEFHMHTGTPESKILEVFAHLKQWYLIAAYDKSEKHGCGVNYWDVLFIDRHADAVRNFKRNVGNYK